jgi:hypothetical protein
MGVRADNYGWIAMLTGPSVFDPKRSAPHKRNGSKGSLEDIGQDADEERQWEELAVWSREQERLRLRQLQVELALREWELENGIASTH